MSLVEKGLKEGHKAWPIFRQYNCSRQSNHDFNWEGKVAFEGNFLRTFF